jgi:signal transduction histidine kinase/CheY-like chemotaxis protein
MNPIRRSSFRRKIAGVTVGAGLLSLMLSCGAFILIDRTAQLRAIQDNLRTLAAIFAYGTAAAVEFSDQKGANDILDGLQAAPEISWAVVFDREGHPFASYRAPGVPVAPLPEIAPQDGVELRGNAAVIARGIELDRERIGTFVAEFSLQTVQQNLVTKAGIVLIVLAACGLLAMLIASRFINAVIRPILDLAALASTVTTTQDYSRRAIKYDDDEVGGLADALNAMLARIESDKDLYAQREKLKKINEALEIEKERALAAVRAKSEFLTNMSHEIRTPMTAILGYVDLLRNEEVDASEGKQMLGVIQRNGKHLISVINDILDLSKLESGKVSIEWLDCALAEVLGDVTMLMRERAVEKRIAFEVTTRGPLPERVRTDPTRLRQILLNLLSNAIKFTAEGSVHLTLESIQEQGKAVLRFEIRDTGIGIPPDKHQAVFQAFGQADTSTTRRFGGTGLGLSISMRLSQLLGGRLELVHSAPGAGTTFELYVPSGVELLQADAAAPAAEPVRAVEVRATSERALPTRLQGRVLVADDSLDNQRLIRTILVRLGLQVEIADNGRIAVEMAQAALDSGSRYDLILMDMQMPEMDGYEATRRLRELEHAEPIVAITAHAMTGERERCINSGCDDYVSKPIDRAQLLRMLERYLAPAKP